MRYYAQLNANKICIGVSQLTGKVDKDDMIEIASADFGFYFNRKYENGTWSAEKYEPKSTAPLEDYEEQKQRIADLEMALAEVLGGV